MASSVSSTTLVPINAITLRPVPIRPADATLAATFDPEALRQSQAQAEALREQEQTRRRDNERSQARGDRRETFTGDSAPFLAQLLNQDQPPPKQPSFADATRAYGRFQEEPQSGFVLDQPARIDVKV